MSKQPSKCRRHKYQPTGEYGTNRSGVRTIKLVCLVCCKRTMRTEAQERAISRLNGGK